MKLLLVLALTALVMGSHAGVPSKPQAPQPPKGKVDLATCTFNGKRLYGRVMYVDSFPDFRVKVVRAFPDLKIQRVTSFPDSCGKWQEVKDFPDLRIKLVDSFPDFTIQYVDAFPGKP